MKKLLLLSVLFSVLVSCGGSKQIEKQLQSGNYDFAITKALKKLKHNKNKKRKQQFVIMLEDAFNKVVDEDLNTIAKFKKDGNPELYKRIFDIYLDLEARQNAIKPVLPLKIGNKVLSLNFKDYSTEIVDYKYKVSDYLIDIGIALLDSENKYKAREAYKIFEYIEDINPNFEETRSMMLEAHNKGTNYVKVSIENQTQQIIPKRLENDLLDFNTYGLNDFWTVYLANTNEEIDYDYAMQLQLKRINVSPERVLEKQLLRKKQIVDGWKYLLDDNGNVAKDSLGNDIKIDKIITAKARLFEFKQQKTTQVIARVVYKDLQTNQVLESFSIDSEFVFENQYAKVRGDKRALKPQDRELLKYSFINFPSNEQMVFDTGEDIKLKLIRIINSYSFRS